MLVGDPIHFDDLLNVEGIEHISRRKLYDAVASRIQSRLLELKIQVDKLASEQLIKLQHPNAGSTEKASDMLQQVDWDSFGLGSCAFTEDDSLEPEIQPKQNITSQREHQEPISTDRSPRMGSMYEGGTMSRMHGYMDSFELLGFAARGVFMTLRPRINTPGVGDASPLRAWKLYLEANLLRPLNAC